MSQGVEKGEVLYDVRADQAAAASPARPHACGTRHRGAERRPGRRGFTRASRMRSQRRIRPQRRVGACARKVDAIKIWVDDRGGRAPSLPIALSRTVSTKATGSLQGLAHVFYHKDAVELADAGINNFAHLVRDLEMSDALIATMMRRHLR